MEDGTCVKVDHVCTLNTTNLVSGGNKVRYEEPHYEGHKSIPWPFIK